MDRRELLGWTGGALLGALLPALPARACEIFPVDGGRDFAIRRGDKTVGRHRIRFAHDGPRFTVRSDVEIQLVSGRDSGYAFEHHAEETWLDGWLDALVSDSRVDGRRYRLRARRRSGIFGGTVNGRHFTVSGYIIPSSLWHHDTPASKALLDTVSGRVKQIHAWRVGTEDLIVAGRPRSAEHYSLRGELVRELWYDADCNLVQAAIPGPDRETLILELR